VHALSRSTGGRFLHVDHSTGGTEHVQHATDSQGGDHRPVRVRCEAIPRKLLGDVPESARNPRAYLVRIVTRQPERVAAHLIRAGRSENFAAKTVCSKGHPPAGSKMAARSTLQ
jgi:hypothetical protein